MVAVPFSPWSAGVSRFSCYHLTLSRNYITVSLNFFHMPSVPIVSSAAQVRSSWCSGPFVYRVRWHFPRNLLISTSSFVLNTVARKYLHHSFLPLIKH